MRVSMVILWLAALAGRSPDGAPAPTDDPRAGGSRGRCRGAERQRGRLSRPLEAPAGRRHGRPGRRPRSRHTRPPDVRLSRGQSDLSRHGLRRWSVRPLRRVRLARLGSGLRGIRPRRRPALRPGARGRPCPRRLVRHRRGAHLAGLRALPLARAGDGGRPLRQRTPHSPAARRGPACARRLSPGPGVRAAGQGRGGRAPGPGAGGRTPDRRAPGRGPLRARAGRPVGTPGTLRGRRRAVRATSPMGTSAPTTRAGARSSWPGPPPSTARTWPTTPEPSVPSSSPRPTPPRPTTAMRT